MKKIKKTDLLLKIIVIIFIGLPVLSLFIKGFFYDGKFTCKFLVEVFKDETILEILKNTLYIGVFTSILSLVVGLFYCVSLVWMDIPLRKYMEKLILVPFFIPGFVGALSFTRGYSRVGYIHKIFAHFNIDLNYDVYSLKGIVIALSFSGGVTAYLFIKKSLENIDYSLEESGRIEGATNWQILIHIIFPVLLPSICTAVLLVFLDAISNYGIILSLGYENNVFAVTTKIFNLLESYSNKDRMHIASILSIVLSIFSLILVMIKSKILKNKDNRSNSSFSKSMRRVDVKNYRYLFTFITLLIVLFTSIIPLISLFLTSISKVPDNPLTLKNITFEHYSYVLTSRTYLQGITTSLELGISTAVIVIIFAYLVAVFNMKKKKSVLETIILIPRALPGVIVSLSILLAFSRPFKFMGRDSIFYGLSFYNTFFIILIGYVVKFTGLALLGIKDAINELESKVEEASMIDGTNFFTFSRYILLPLIKDKIFILFFLILIPAIRDLSISQMLVAPSNETIAVVIFREQFQGSITVSATASIILILFTSFLQSTSNFLINKFSKK